MGTKTAHKALLEINYLDSPSYEKQGSDHWTSWNAAPPTTVSGYIEAALRWKCEQFPQAPFCILRESKGANNSTKYDKVEGHPALPILKFPCGTARGAHTRPEFLERMVRSYELDGNAYAYRVLNGLYDTAYFRYLPFTAVSPQRRPGSPNLIDFYAWTNDAGEYIEIPVSQMVHWKQGVNPANEALGYSPLKSVLREILTEQELSLYLSKISRTGKPARAIWPKDGEDGVEWTEDFVNGAKEGYRRSENSLMVFDRPIETKDFSAGPADMAIDKINALPKEKIISVLNVNPALIHLMGYGDAKNTDEKEVMANGWKASLLPMGLSLCERLTLDFLPDYGDIRTECVAMDVDNVPALQEDRNKLFERWFKAYLADLPTKNEGRRALGLEDIEDGDKTFRMYPQLFAGDGNANTLLHGTNGKLGNEAADSNQAGAA
jgi:phage portal protein BeeE